MRAPPYCHALGPACERLSEGEADGQLEVGALQATLRLALGVQAGVLGLRLALGVLAGVLGLRLALGVQAGVLGEAGGAGRCRACWGGYS